MNWELKSDRPIYLQLMEQIKLKIVSGQYPPGERLASVRDMAQEASVNPNTMQKALSELERDGLVISQRTSGRFITEDKAAIDRIREGLLMEQIAGFLTQMEKLGLSRAEMLELMAKAEGETN